MCAHVQVPQRPEEGSVLTAMWVQSSLELLGMGAGKRVKFPAGTAMNLNHCVGSLALWIVTFWSWLFNMAWYIWETFKLLASSRIVLFFTDSDYSLARGGLYSFQSGVMIKKVQMGWVILLVINHSFLSSSTQQEIRLHSIKKKFWLWLTSRTAIIFPSLGK